MEQIKVVCPNCKSRITIAYAPGIQDKRLVCPTCGLKDKVSAYQNSQPESGNKTKGDSTQVNLAPIDSAIGSLFVCDKEFALKKGIIIVGRQAVTSTATLQIPTKDMYMSRVCASITVREGKQGIEHLLEPMNPKNPILINGKRLEQGDIIVLCYGDRLIFGRTEVRFDRPTVDDNEQTLLS